MSRKILTVFTIAFIAIFASTTLVLTNQDFAFAQEIPYTNQNFDNLFTMEFPLGKEYVDISSNRSSGSLGSAREYVDNNSDGNLRQGDINIYYYDTSLLNSSQTNLLNHVLDDLTSTYSYQLNQNETDLIILQNENEMCGMPFFLAGKASDDGSKVVFAGGENLSELEQYVKTIEFS